jgi:hypothetical protein
VVARCETLGLIAVRAGVSLDELLTLNPEICNVNLVFEGQAIRLPPRD